MEKRTLADYIFMKKITMEDYNYIIKNFPDRYGYLSFRNMPEYNYHWAWNMIYRVYGRAVANFWLELYKQRLKGIEHNEEKLEVMKK